MTLRALLDDHRRRKDDGREKFKGSRCVYGGSIAALFLSDFELEKTIIASASVV